MSRWNDCKTHRPNHGLSSAELSKSAKTSQHPLPRRLTSSPLPIRVLPPPTSPTDPPPKSIAAQPTHPMPWYIEPCNPRAPHTVPQSISADHPTSSAPPPCVQRARTNPRKHTAGRAPRSTDRGDSNPCRSPAEPSFPAAARRRVHCRRHRPGAPEPETPHRLSGAASENPLRQLRPEVHAISRVRFPRPVHTRDRRKRIIAEPNQRSFCNLRIAARGRRSVAIADPGVHIGDHRPPEVLDRQRRLGLLPEQISGFPFCRRKWPGKMLQSGEVIDANIVRRSPHPAFRQR